MKRKVKEAERSRKAAERSRRKSCGRPGALRKKTCALRLPGEAKEACSAASAHRQCAPPSVTMPLSLSSVVALGRMVLMALATLSRQWKHGYRHAPPPPPPLQRPQNYSSCRRRRRRDEDSYGCDDDSYGNKSQSFRKEGKNPASVDSGIYSAYERYKSSIPNSLGKKSTVNERLLKEFEDIQWIGGGGFGCVFQAQHKVDEKKYAIKRVELNIGYDKVKREVNALANLNHRNIVWYYTCWTGKDSFESEDRQSDGSLGRRRLCDCLFIQMELCSKTLKRWIDQEREKASYEVDSFLKFREIVEGVAYIHKMHLIHRDLKPANIFISSEDTIKIGDFGLVTRDVGNLPMERTGRKGTRVYMAPEQKGNSYTNKVDIFPLGLIWYEMLYRSRAECEEWGNIRQCKFPPAFTCKFPAEKSIIVRLLSRYPAERPSAQDIAQLLQEKFYISY